MITDEQIIEAMAKAIAENWDDNFPSANERDYAARAKDNDYRHAARDALAVAKPLIREQALMDAVSALKIASNRAEDRVIEAVYNLSAALVLSLIPERPQ